MDNLNAYVKKRRYDACFQGEKRSRIFERVFMTVCFACIVQVGKTVIHLWQTIVIFSQSLTVLKRVCAHLRCQRKRVVNCLCEIPGHRLHTSYFCLHCIRIWTMWWRKSRKFQRYKIYKHYKVRRFPFSCNKITYMSRNSDGAAIAVSAPLLSQIFACQVWNYTNTFKYGASRIQQVTSLNILTKCIATSY